MLRSLLCFFLLFGSLTAFGEWQTGYDQQPAEAATFRASVDNFGAMVLITNDPDTFFEQWNKPPVEGKPPQLTTTNVAKKGDTVMALIFFSGCTPNELGNCVSETDFKLLDPKGEVYGKIENAELWRDRPAPPPGSLQVGVDYMAFRVEQDDLIGEYRFNITVRDLVKKVSLDLSHPIQITEG